MLRFGLIVGLGLVLAGCYPNKQQAYEDFCLFHPTTCNATDHIRAGYEHVRDEVTTQILRH